VELHHFTIPPKSRVNLINGVDPGSILLGVLILPLLYFTLKLLRKFLQEHLQRLLEALFWYGGRVFNRALANRVSVRQYSRIQLGKRSLQFFTVPGEAETSLPIDEVFVPLRLDDPSGRASTRTHLDFLEPGARVRIVGDPGSGKSSLVKRVFRDACERARGGGNKSSTSTDQSVPRMLPVLVELKQFLPPEGLQDDNQRARWGVDQLRAAVTSVQGFGFEAMFDSFMTGDGLLVLLDGLDEVASESYPRTARTIRALSDSLADQSEQNAVVVTMRSQFHRQIRRDFDESFPDLFYIEPFRPADIYTFLTRWPYGRHAEDEVGRIYGELTDRPTLRDMCRNPLVLAMYVAADQRGGEVNKADVRTSFYDQVVGELLVKRRSRQWETTTHTVLLDQREEIFGSLAYGNLIDDTQPANSIRRQRAIEKVMDARNLPSAGEADHELDQLATETGIIDHERPGESLRFIHLSFCEFLAAKYAALRQSGGWEALLQRHARFQQSESPQARSRLVEALPFAVALLPPAARRDAIQQVAVLGDRQVLGRCFLESQLYNHARWSEYVNEEMQSLLSVPAEKWTEDWLRRLQLFTVVVRDAHEWGRLSGQPVSVPIESLFGDLVGSDRERLARVFSSFATHDPAAAFRLAESTGVDLTRDQPELVFANSSDPPFLATALQRALASRADARRWAPLLAEAALRQPAAASLLHARTAPPEVTRSVEKAPRERSWSSLGQVIPPADIENTRAEQRSSDALSCYGVFLSLALTSPGDVRHACLSVLRAVPPPTKSSRLPQMLAFIVTIACGVGLYWFVLANLTSVLEPRGLLGLIAIELVAVVLIMWAAAVARLPVDRLRLYSSLINLGPDPDRISGPVVVRLLRVHQRLVHRIFLKGLVDATTAMGHVRTPGLTSTSHLGEPQSTSRPETAPTS
jgi:hypothetical protein